MRFDPLHGIRSFLKPFIRRQLNRLLLHNYTYVGEVKRLRIASSSVVNNAFFNLFSGTITVKEHAFFGYHVSVLTGTHNYNKFGEDRGNDVPTAGRDIVIETGAWIGTNVTIIGPCIIGEHSVVAAGAVVTKDVASYTVVAGVPARMVKVLRRDGQTQDEQPDTR